MIRKSERDYIALWKEVRSKLARAAELDPLRLDKNQRKCRLIFGAEAHGYRVNPILNAEIDAYEAKYKMEFPLNFRTYMKVIGSSLPRPRYQYFTSTSPGPGYGISNVIAEGPTSPSFYTPSPLEPQRSSIGFCIVDDENDDLVLSDREYPFSYEDVEKGTIEIGTSGNPCVFHLVIHGDTRGDVFSCTGDMLFNHGSSFEEWYLAWLDEILNELESGAALDRFNQRFSLDSGKS